MYTGGYVQPQVIILVALSVALESLKMVFIMRALYINGANWIHNRYWILRSF